ncbi:MAG: nitronate monooxygenase [Bacteroidales bacterium]|nr:nitronate monooxygenase [Bacteroidales bacterium]MDD2575922.1 nitronate monooxygenase [Bacteroidales bacterium]MDD4067350.1 nitronate monooxygenase [Bacteroidales bacterium]MDD4738788.1 nitronate monooxygenase [Bacteroidales bacterium]
MNNRICEILNIQTPIISGGMVWCSGWELASAVSNEGGLGLIGAGSMNEGVLLDHIIKCKSSTNNTYGVNIPLMDPKSSSHIEIVIKEKVPVVFTSAGNPSTYTQKLKDNGIKVVHVVANEKFALKAQEAGVDAIVGEGFEAGGHNGKEETTTLVLINQLKNIVDIPIIAAGGIASGEQILAMMILGAEGVQIGSLFASSIESSAHINFKNAIIDAKEGDTQLLLRKLSPTRLLKGGFYDKIKEAEDRGATKDELLEIIGVGKTKKGMFEGNLEEGELEIGQVSSVINEVLSVKYIFSKLKKEYSIALNKTDNLIKTL